MARTRFLSAVLLSALLLVARIASAATLALVSIDDNSLIFYRLSSNLGVMAPLKTIPLGKMPVGTCVDPNGSRIYISEVMDKKVAVIDVASQSVISRYDEPAMKRAAWCVVSPDSKKLYVMDAVGNAVFVHDTGSGQLMKQIPVGGEPTHGVFSPDGKRLIVSNSGANTLTAIDPATDTVVKTVKTGHEPSYLTFSRDGKFLMVALIDDDSVAFFKSDTLEFDQQVGVSQSPQVLIESADGNFLYVLGRWHGELGLLNLRPRGERRRIVGKISLPAYPTGMAMSPDGRHLYVSTSTFQETLSHIDVEAQNVDFTISGIKHPGDVIYLK